MTVYLDESVPARLARALASVGCRALRFPNKWKGLKNGALLRSLQERQVACLVTCDKNIRHQQTIAGTGLSLVILPRQRFADLVPILPQIAAAVGQAHPDDVLLVESDGAISKV